MSIKVALAGNPNCGKTTLFNELTGSNQFVGNWPGVTVEKKEGKLKKTYSRGEDISIIDLPGIYSLSPYTLEEVVTRNYIVNEKPDVIINIIDGSNLERNLYLTTQIMELGIPVILAVNMMDVVEKNGDKIFVDKLEKKLSCKVVKISALKKSGINELIDAVENVNTATVSMNTNFYSDDIEDLIVNVCDKLTSVDENQRRFVAIKVIEKDEKVSDFIENIPNVDNEVSKIEKEYDDYSESIITNQRYEYITSIIDDCYKKNNSNKLTRSDKIDKIVTNRILALPIFAIVMFIVYYLSIGTIGTWGTDYINDGIFGESFNFFGMDVKSLPTLIGEFLESINCNEVLSSLVLDGIVAGVGAVLGFLPQMLVLFICLAFLEACGYMARVAFVMDRIFRKFGLSGKSFIPMLIGSGCGVPGIMASRTIENERDRKMTVITTTFIPCGAKLPIIALISGAVFDGAWWIASISYFIGVFAVVCSGIILKKTKMFSGNVAPFVMELPAYHMPTLKNVLKSMWERGYAFIKKAGTIILLSTIVLWFMMSFGVKDGSFKMLEGEELEYSILAVFGKIIAPLFAPLGWGDWKACVGTVTGLIAKENLVGTFGVLFGKLAEVAEDGEEIWEALAKDMTQVVAMSFLVFNLLCAPCFAAMGAIKREMNDRKWFWFAIGYQTIFAYVMSLIVYQVLNLCVNGVFGVGTVFGFIAIIAFVYLLVRPNKQTQN